MAFKYDLSEISEIDHQLSLDERLERSKKVKEQLIKIREERRKMFPATKICVIPLNGMTMDDIPSVFSEFVEYIVNKRDIEGKAWILTFTDETILKRVLSSTFTFSGNTLHIESCNCM